MTGQTREILQNVGIDLDAAKQRLMGNEKLLLRMLFKIDADQSYRELAEVFEQTDVEKMIHVSHSLKGLFGNLSVMPLYTLFTEQTKLLRAGELDAAKAMLPDAKCKLHALKEALDLAKQAEENA